MADTKMTKLELLNSCVSKAVAADTTEEQYALSIGKIDKIFWPSKHEIDVLDPETELDTDARFNALNHILQDEVISKQDYKHIHTIELLENLSRLEEYFKDFNPEQQSFFLNSALGFSKQEMKNLQTEKAVVHLLHNLETFLFRHCKALTALQFASVAKTMLDTTVVLEFKEAKENILGDLMGALMHCQSKEDIPDADLHEMFYRFVQQPDIENPSEHYWDMNSKIRQILVYTKFSRPQDEFLRNVDEIFWSQADSFTITGEEGITLVKRGNNLGMDQKEIIISEYEKKYGKPQLQPTA